MRPSCDDPGGAGEGPEWGKGRRKARSSAVHQIADIGVSSYLDQAQGADEIGLFVNYGFTPSGQHRRHALPKNAPRLGRPRCRDGGARRHHHEAIRDSLTCLQRRAAKARSHRLRKRLRPTPGGRRDFPVRVSAP